MRVRAIYFSPTGNTRRVTMHIAQRLAKRLGIECVETPYTLPWQRAEWESLGREDLVVWGSPVYAGRVPNKTLDFLREILHGEGNPAVVVATYGNRSFGDAPAEMCGMLEDGGMHPVAAAAVVAQHAFAQAAGKGRPNEVDRQEIDHFVDEIPMERLTTSDRAILEPSGSKHPENYYVPLRMDGQPARFLKARPKVDMTRCDGCGRCQEVCPMGSIGWENSRPLHQGICIKCQACIQSCPTTAIAIEDPDFASHREMLEAHYTSPAENRFWTI